jgi:hypothetical protein
MAFDQPTPTSIPGSHHQLTGFRCRSEKQSAWLVDVAKQAHGTGTTRVLLAQGDPATSIEEDQLACATALRPNTSSVEMCGKRKPAWCTANVYAVGRRP